MIKTRVQQVAHPTLAGRNIGIDKYGNNGQPGTTSKLTVITDKKGNLVTTYPGTTKIP